MHAHAHTRSHTQSHTNKQTHTYTVTDSTRTMMKVALDTTKHSTTGSLTDKSIETHIHNPMHTDRPLSVRTRHRHMHTDKEAETDTQTDGQEIDSRNKDKHEYIHVQKYTGENGYASVNRERHNHPDRGQTNQTDKAYKIERPTRQKADKQTISQYSSQRGRRTYSQTDKQTARHVHIHAQEVHNRGNINPNANRIFAQARLLWQPFIQRHRRLGTIVSDISKQMLLSCALPQQQRQQQQPSHPPKRIVAPVSLFALSQRRGHHIARVHPGPVSPIRRCRSCVFVARDGRLQDRIFASI